MDTVRKLRALFGRKEKRKFLLLFILMIFAAVFETAGIGLIVPFVGIVTNPSSIHTNEILSVVYNTIGFTSTTSFIIVATICLITYFILKNAYLIWFHYIQYKTIYAEQVKLSKRLFQSYLKRPYTFHLQRNSAQLLRNTNIEVQRIFHQMVRPAFLFLTELSVVLCILVLLLVMAPLATLISAVVLGGGVVLFFKVFRKRISQAGLVQQQSQGDMIKWVNQGLGASKEVKVFGREKFFINAYVDQSKKFASAMRFYQLMRQIPRLFIETIVVSTILVIILVIMIQSANLSTLLATTALFAMAAFRLMPSIARMTSSQTDIRNTKPALDLVYNDLIDEKVEEDVYIENRQAPTIINANDEKTFKHSIDVEHITFRYPGSHEEAIKNVSLSIPIGSSVAFVGPSGSGKTTMVDIILGVLEPESGAVTVDGKNIKEIETTWQRKIGYIPQFIYLSDDTIRSNVAFGLSSELISDEAVWRALEQAQLKEFVESLPEKLDTMIGERGVRLSGGQRQRIGIARALYHNPEILFMDEATSALDNETEKEIMKAIDGLKGEKTLVIIAHRLSTIENCDVVFHLQDGYVSEQSYSKQRAIQ